MWKYLGCIALASVPLVLLTARDARTALEDDRPTDETDAVAAELEKLDALRERADAAISVGAADAAAVAVDRLAGTRLLAAPPATSSMVGPPGPLGNDGSLWATGRARAEAALQGQEVTDELAVAVAKSDRGDRVAALLQFQQDHFGPDAAEPAADLRKADALRRAVDDALTLARSEQGYREELAEAETLFNRSDFAGALKVLDEADALTTGDGLAADRQRAKLLRGRAEFHRRAMGLPAVSGAEWDNPAALTARSRELADFFADFPAPPSMAAMDTATFRALEDRRETVEAARDVHAALADLTTSADRPAVERFPLGKLTAAVERLAPAGGTGTYDGPHIAGRVERWLAQPATTKPPLDYAGRHIQEAQTAGDITLDDTIGPVPEGGWIRGRFTPRGTQGRMDFLPARPQAKPADDPAESAAENAAPRTDTVHRDSFATGPRPVATERMVREYNAAWDALFDDRQRWRSRSAWSDFAQTCRRLQTELDEYRDAGGLEPVGFPVPPAERELSFMEPSMAAGRVVAEWPRIAALLRLGPRSENPDGPTNPPEGQ
jgi:hypothetical protein